MVRVTIATDLADVADVWPRLADMGRADVDCAGWPFQARDYLEVWLKTMGAARGTQAFFVRVDDAEGRLWLLAPLGVERRQGAKILGFLDGGVVDYAAPIIFPREGRAAVSPVVLWEAIFRALPPFDVLNLEKVSEYVHDTPNPLFGVCAPDLSTDGHVVRLSGTWDEFAKQRLPRASTLRRHRRKLEERGEVRFVIAETEQQRAAFMAAMIRQKTRRYVETRGVDGFERPGYRAYFPELTDRFAAQGAIHLSALMVGDTIVATHWGMVSGKRFYYLMPATEGGDWQKFSVGGLLTADLIKWCYENGYTAFDLGAGDEPYKYEFEPETLVLRRFLFGRSLFGKTMVTAWKTLRQVKARLRPAPVAAGAA